MAIKEVGIKTTYTQTGAEKAIQTSKKHTEELLKGAATAPKFEALDKSVHRVAKQFAGLGASVKGVNSLLKNLGDLKSVAELRKELEATTKEVDKLTAALRKKDDQEKAAAGRRSFGMGVAQGLGIGEYFPERGLGANLAGRALGVAGRAGASLAGTPISGVAGLTQAMGSVPGVGQVLAGQMNAGFASVSRAMAAEEQFRAMGIGPLGGFRASSANLEAVPALDFGKAKEAGAAAAAAAWSEGEESLFRRAVQAKAAIARGEAGTFEYGEKPDEFRVSGQMRAKEIRDSEEAARAALEPRRFDLANQAGLAASSAEIVRQQAEQQAIRGRNMTAEARARSGGGLFEEIMDMGARYGYQPESALEMAGGFFPQMSGEYRPGQNRMLELGMAAKSRFALDPSVAAAFARGSDTGAVRGSGEGAFVQTLQNALQLGLRNSDLTAYMQQAAGSLKEMEQNGIRPNLQAQAEMERALQPQVGNLAATRMTQGLLGAARGIASSGPTDAAQVQLLQALGGYGGGGLEDYAAAQERLETGNIRKGGLQEFIQRQAITGNAAGDELSVQAALQRVGISASREQVRSVLGRGDPALLKKWQEQATSGAQITGEGLLGMGAAAAPAGASKSAAMGGADIRTGQKMTDPMLELQNSAKMFTNTMTKLAPALGALTSKIEDASVKISEVIGPLLDNLVRAIPVH